MPADRDRAGPIAGVVLAAGSSVRMGTNKLLLELGGESVLRRVVRRVAEAGLDPVLVVLGHEADRARAELGGLPCSPIVNPDHARGMNTSLGAGIAAIPKEAIAALVALADMPLVTVAMMDELVQRYRRGTAPLIVSEYGGIAAPPMLYDRALFGELRGLEGDGCGKRAVRRHRAEAVMVPWPAAALGDLDERADYERVRGELGRE
jgi:molybdenum cofactor cytidylyltransferase